MASLAEVRSQYPQYQDMSDQDLADALYRKFYSDMPRTQFEEKIGLAKQREVGMGEDIVRSGATGLRQGVESSIGMFGDAAKMTGDALGWAAGKVGFGETGQDVARTIGRRVNPFGFALTTDEIQENLTKPVVGEHYQPQTVAGEYARTIGQFAPAAVAGPGTVARKAAMTVVPAMASETAGQFTKGSEFEPYARLAGGLAGGVAAMGKPSMQNMKEAAKGAPTKEVLKQHTDNLYNQLRSAGITYDSNAYANAVTKAASTLKAQGIRRSMASDAYGLLDELADDIAKGAVPDFNEINSLAQQAGAAAEDAFVAMSRGDRTAGTNGKAWSIVRDMLDDFERTAPMTNTAGLSASQVAQLRGAARATALKNIKARRIENVVRNAESYAAGSEAGLRQGLRNLMKSKAGRIFSPEERSAILEIANGRKALLTLSKFGFDLTSFMGNATFLPTIGAGAAGAAFGIPVGAALAGAGTAAKFASPALTNRLLEQTTAAIRGGGLTGPQSAKNLKALQQARNIRALLSTTGNINASGLPIR